jgi:hypothetical protein
MGIRISGGSSLQPAVGKTENYEHRTQNPQALSDLSLG